MLKKPTIKTSGFSGPKVKLPVVKAKSPKVTPPKQLKFKRPDEKK